MQGLSEFYELLNSKDQDRNYLIILAKEQSIETRQSIMAEKMKAEMLYNSIFDFSYNMISENEAYYKKPSSENQDNSTTVMSTIEKPLNSFFNTLESVDNANDDKYIAFNQVSFTKELVKSIESTSLNEINETKRRPSHQKIESNADTSCTSERKQETFSPSLKNESKLEKNVKKKSGNFKASRNVTQPKTDLSKTNSPSSFPVKRTAK